MSPTKSMPFWNIRVFCAGRRQAKLAATFPSGLVLRYPAFLLIAAKPDTVLSSVQRIFKKGEWPVIEDIARISRPIVAGQEIDTTKERERRDGTVAAHPFYKHFSPRSKLSRGRHHYLVQFIGPPLPSWVKAVQECGGQVVSSGGRFTIVARASRLEVRRIVALDCVRWVGHLPHETRLRMRQRSLPRSAASLRRPKSLSVVLYGPGYASRFKRWCKRERATVLISSACQRRHVILPPPLDKDFTHRLSTVHGVRGIYLVGMPSVHSAEARSILMTGTPAIGVGSKLPQIGANGALDGAGEIVAICDSGLDYGVLELVHPDLAGRVAGIRSFPVRENDKSQPSLMPDPAFENWDDGAADLSGHGSRCAGMIAGKGPNGISGLAPGARIYFQAVEQRYLGSPSCLRVDLSGIPDNLTTLFQDAFEKGARIHSNSWGFGSKQNFQNYSGELDEFAWHNKSFCIVFSAGNDFSKDAPQSGGIEFPANAMNCITVGASEGWDPDPRTPTWGDFEVIEKGKPKKPFAGKNFSANSIAANPNSVAAFSARGPAGYGAINRFKPDVVAPGTRILSTKSLYLSNNIPQYAVMDGTSAAAPLVAGALAVIRQHLRRDFGLAEPSAALLKAVLVNGCIRIGGDQIVDNDRGFGRVCLADSIREPGTAIRIADEAVGLTDSGQETWTCTVRVEAGTPVLSVTMCYTDRPNGQPVNDLNLKVRGPDGSFWIGNSNTRYGAGNAPELAEFDHSNNSERVIVDAPEAGEWRITVFASSIHSDALGSNQPFAVCATAQFPADGQLFLR